MPTIRLQHLLKQLHQEIDTLGENNPEETQRLERLTAEIELALDQQQPETHETLLDGVKVNLAEFESEHPTASGIVRRLMQALGDMGI